MGKIFITSDMSASDKYTQGSGFVFEILAGDDSAHVLVSTWPQ